jgi:hypothetical protein
MTQAFNLSQLANNLNTSGQLDATDGLTGAVPVANGGTGQTTYSNGQLLIGNGTGLTKANITAGSGISVTNGSGSITIASSGGGVTSLNGQTGAITNTNLNAIGSVSACLYAVSGTTTLNTALFLNADTTVAGSSLRNTVANNTDYTAVVGYQRLNSTAYGGGGSGLSGTWRTMGKQVYFFNFNQGCGNYMAVWVSTILMVRVS